MTGKITQGRARPLGAYPHVRQAGDFLFLSGTTARRADGSVAGVSANPDGSAARDIITQTRVVIENVRATLGSEGASLKDCVEIVVFLVDMADFAAMNQVYAEYFSEDGPARTTVAVRALPHPDMIVEMKVIACKPAAFEPANA